MSEFEIKKTLMDSKTIEFNVRRLTDIFIFYFLFFLIYIRVLFGLLVSYFLVTAGVIYDIIVEPPSVGSTTDQYGHHKPVAFMAWRINGQYIMEGLAAAFMFTLGGLGFILLDQTNKPNMPKLNRVLMILCSFIFILVAYVATKIFIR
jgi:hypothetical protein